MGYEVTTPVFEGPFDLLLHLILREQVDLYEVSLSAIVDAYLVEIERMQSVDLDVATEFLLIAATLVELKARRLLPVPEGVDVDDELVPWEERDLLLARLVECKTFKDVAAVLAALADESARSFPRTAPMEEPYASLQPDLLAGLSAERLRRAFLKATTPKPAVTVDLAHVTPVRITVAEAVHELLDELPRVGRITFRRLTGALADRVEVIVRFLAVLELYKQGVIELDQPATFGDITISWQGTHGESEAELVGAMDVYDG